MFVQAAVRSKDVERGAVVNVLASLKGLDERLLLSQVREHAQFDLRVVRRDQNEAGLCDERAPYLAAQVRPDRDVLQIWIAAAEPPRGRHRLVE